MKPKYLAALVAAILVTTMSAATRPEPTPQSLQTLYARWVECTIEFGEANDAFLEGVRQTGLVMLSEDLSPELDRALGRLFGDVGANHQNAIRRMALSANSMILELRRQGIVRRVGDDHSCPRG